MRRWIFVAILLLLAGAGPAKKPPRIVAIGDLHGDIDAARDALRLAGAIDLKGHWIGGDLIVVQTGDELDRGDGDKDILELFDRLADEAAKAGGRVIAINGNHEIMNVQGDCRYVTPGGFAAWGGEDQRRAAFAPGGPEARRLARRPIYARVGDTLFVHGGILPDHVRAGLDKLDAATRAWMEGRAAHPPADVVAEDGPLWTRRYGHDHPDCALLDETLKLAGARRMVVGHTPQQKGITSACDGRLWRIDVGLAAVYGGPLEVLLIDGDDIRPLSIPR